MCIYYTVYTHILVVPFHLTLECVSQRVQTVMASLLTCACINMYTKRQCV